MTARKANRAPIGVIDIFAGPGGLGEGFSSFQDSRGSQSFELGVSAEMELSAHATLRLRAFLRLLRDQEGAYPRPYAEFLSLVASGAVRDPADHFGTGPLASLWRTADEEALHLTLGTAEDNARLYSRISTLRRAYERLVLIGGPPCQAYSVVGRARQRNVRGFSTRGDHRHFLYREYLHILATYEPDVFIMENVRGMLTSKVAGKRMFESIHADLSNPSRALGGVGKRPSHGSEYLILPIHVPESESRCPDKARDDPTSFVVRCEEHGVPQARHRVILMGVRSDHAHLALSVGGLSSPSISVDVEAAFAGLPSLRSGLSKGHDSADAWGRAVNRERKRVIAAIARRDTPLAARLEAVEPRSHLARVSTRYDQRTSPYAELIRHSAQSVVLNHETRTHMESDLGRYLFCSSFGIQNGRSPYSSEFPGKLAPDHVNWDSGAFADRFRVQIKKGRPASTVTSHIAKDGHAFIHWDPGQCRSLTVREAARLQSFPDDYLFLGNRTQQYVQVGNAVPPLVASQIAGVVWNILGR